MTSYLSLEAIKRHKVVSRDGDVLGRVDDLVFDPTSGEIRYVILASGGALGIGDKLFVVPFADAEIDYPRERLIFNFSADDVKTAPGFVRGEFPDFAPAYRKDIEGFYAARRKAA